MQLARTLAGVATVPAAAPRLRLAWLAYLLIAYAMPFVGFGLVGVLVQGDPVPLITNELGFSHPGYFALGLYGSGAGLAAFLLFRRAHRSGISSGALGLGDRLTVRAAATAVIVAAASLALLAVLSRRGLIDATPGDKVVLVAPMDWAAAIVGGLLLVPVSEEIFFRGFLINALRQRGHSFLQSAAVSAVIFGVAHMSFGWVGAVSSVMGGALAASFYFRFGNIYAGMLLHGLYNLGFVAVLT